MNEKQILENFARVMAMAWSDEDYKEQLLDNPKEVLAAAGIETPPNAQIKINEVDTAAHHEGTVEEGRPSFDSWFQGYQTGQFEFTLTQAPEGFDLGNMMLSDVQLDTVAGGVYADSSEGCCTYCCCPCTCCT
jgi:hypothetical protein